MNKKNIETFVNSDHGSIEEQTFLDSTMNQYYTKKLRSKYESILEDDYNIKAVSEQSAILTAGKKKNHLVRNLLIVLSGIAILLVSLFLTKDILFKAEPPAIYASLDNVYIEMPGAMRGIETETNQRIKNMSSAYAEKKFDVVLQNYQAIEDKSVLNDNSLIEASISFAHSGNNNEAIRIITDLMPSVSDARQQELQWVLINLYLISNNRVDAQKVFEQMQASDYKYKESEALLAK